MYVGFNASREFTTEDVAVVLRRLVPLSRSQKETIALLRAWLEEGRAQSASLAESAGDSRTGPATGNWLRTIQLDSPPGSALRTARSFRASTAGVNGLGKNVGPAPDIPRRRSVSSV